MKRRDFLAATSTFLLPVMVEGFGVKAFGINSPLVQSLLKTNALAKDRALVIIYLSGGNDGLNTVIPLDQMSQYTNLRTNIAIPEPSVLRLGDGSTGLHPSMTGLKQMHDNGKLSVVHSVSYPTPSYSHHRASEIWMTATDSNVVDITSGWAGRYLENRFTNYPIVPVTDRDNLNAVMEDPLAIQIGFLASQTLLGSSQTMTITINDPATFEVLVGGGGTSFPPVDLPCDNACEAADLISFIRNQQALAIAYGKEITAANNAGKTTTPPVYPTNNSLADQLKIVARLIGGGLKTKVYFVSMGGFDTHSAQVQTDDKTKGSHATLLGKLSAGIKAFQDDLQSRGIEDKVAGFTFSEFGRRATSNASTGTDHGSAAPMFVFGSSLKRQSVGRNPNIGGYSNLPTDLQGTTSSQDLKMQIDFRRIYWDILTDWFGTSKTDAASLFLNKSFDTVSLFTDDVCTIKTGTWHDEKTWSCGRVPFFTENIRICEGHTVTVGVNTLVKKMQNFGKLIVAPGIKFSLG